MLQIAAAMAVLRQTARAVSQQLEKQLHAL